MVITEIGQESLSQDDHFVFNQAEARGRKGLIDTSGQRWDIGENVKKSLNFDRIAITNPYLIDQLKYYVAERLNKWSPITVYNHFNAIVFFLNSCSEVNDEEYGESLEESLQDEINRYFIANRNSKDEHQLSLIRDWYCTSESLGLPAFNEYVALHLKNLKLKGNVKGLDVRIEIDGRGALSTVEFYRLKELLNNYSGEFVSGSPSYWKLIATWVFIVLGIRPEQLRLLMDEDLQIKTSEKGSKIYLLNVPSVKKHYSLPRTYFKKRPIPAFLGEMIEMLIVSNHEYAQKRGWAFESLPIFMSSNTGHVDGRIVGVDLARLSPTTISLSSKNLLETINAEELRRGYRLFDINLNPRRLRKTFASQAAAQGVPARVLAELLDHEDLQHVMVYYEQSPEFTRKLDVVYRESFGELFEFFKGNITLETVVKAHKEQVIYGPENLRRLVEIGFCGSDQRCRLAPPYSCYGCDKLQACDNKAVHEEVLKSMKDEIDELFLHQAQPGRYDAEHILACQQLITQLEGSE